MFRIEDEPTDHHDPDRRRGIEDLIEAIDHLSKAVEVEPDRVISALTGLVRRRESFERLRARLDIRHS